MRVLVTGAWPHCLRSDPPAHVRRSRRHGLARSDRAAAAVAALGADVRSGHLDDLETLGAAAREADGVIHLAFKHDEQNSGNLAAAVESDLRAIRALGEALVGSDKPFVGTNATGAMALAGFTGELTERDVLPGGPRVDAENSVIAFAERGVRASVVRLPPTVHSAGEYGFASGLIQNARTTGVSGYLGEGSNRWPSAHTRDVADLYRLAIESAPAGMRMHAVAEQGIPIRQIAEAIGRRLELPATSVAFEDAEQHFGYLAPFVSIDNLTSSRQTRETLNWSPSGPDLIVELTQDPCLSAEGR